MNKYPRHPMMTDRTHVLETAKRPECLDGPIYLDHNATTPVDPRVLEAMLPYLHTHFGNPSSDHPYASAPKRAVAGARAQVAELVGANPDEITFMGSGSEADATAIRGVVAAALTAGVRKPHVITQATEHPAVLAACQYAERFHGAEVTVVPVDRDGLVDLDEVASAMRPTTVLLSIMHANNETGVIQPVRELAAVAHDHGALFHTDAAQTVGKIPVDVTDLGVDLLTLVGHKMYAPKGIAALYIRNGTRIEPLIGGGGQERGLRAGTENVPYIVALGAAAAIAATDLAAGDSDRLTALRDELERELVKRLPGRVHLNGHRVRRLPQTLNVSVDGVTGHEVLAACAEVAASTGSACHSGTHTPSPVLLAMGLSPERALSALRLTLGRWTTRADVVLAAEALAHASDAPANSASPRRQRTEHPARPEMASGQGGAVAGTVAIDVLLEAARQGLDRVQPADLAAEITAGALIVDIRPIEQRQRDGDMPGALVIDRNVLEWRLDPTSPNHAPAMTDAGRRVVIICNQGYSSSLAAATLRRLGLRRATDLDGGYQAWARYANQHPEGQAHP